MRGERGADDPGLIPSIAMRIRLTGVPRKFQLIGAADLHRAVRCRSGFKMMESRLDHRFMR